MADVQNGVDAQLQQSPIHDGQGIFCPNCKEQYCWMYGEDCMTTSLSCGHMLCFKCAKSQWSESNSEETTVFCVTCSADVEISTLKCPPFAKPDPQKAESCVSLSQSRSAVSVGENILSTVAQTTPSHVRGTGDLPQLPNSAGSATCSGDRETSTLSSPLVLDKIQSQDDAWRLLQNDEGFIRDWIVANVPDHVLFKMVGEGSVDASSLDTNNLVFSTGNTVVITSPPSTVESMSTTPETAGLCSTAPGCDSATKASFEQQFLHYLVNKAVQNRSPNSEDEDPDQDLDDAGPNADCGVVQEDSMPEVFMANAVVDGGAQTIGNKGDCGVPMGKYSQHLVHGDASRMSADGEASQLNARNVSDGHAQSLLKEASRETLMENQFSNAPRHARAAFAHRPSSPHTLAYAPGTAPFQTPRFQHNYPPNFYEEGPAGYPGYNARGQLYMEDIPSVQNLASTGAHGAGSNHRYQYGQFYPTQKQYGSRYSSRQYRSGSRAGQNSSQRGSRSRSRRASSPKSFSWFSQACSSSLNTAPPPPRYSSQPQIRCVQVLRPKPENASQQEGSENGDASGKETAPDGSKAESQSVETEEAEVAVMKTRNMPHGTRVEDIYVVPQVWLNDGTTTQSPAQNNCSSPVYETSFQDRDDQLSEQYNASMASSVAGPRFTITHVQEGAQKRGLVPVDQEVEMLATAGQDEVTEQDYEEEEMMEGEDTSLSDGMPLERAMEEGNDFADFQPVAVVTTMPANRSRLDATQHTLELLTHNGASSAIHSSVPTSLMATGWEQTPVSSGRVVAAGIKRKVESVLELETPHSMDNPMGMAQRSVLIAANGDDGVEIIEQRSTRPASILLPRADLGEAGGPNKKKPRRNLTSEFYKAMDGQDQAQDFSERPATSFVPTGMRGRWYRSKYDVYPSDSPYGNQPSPRPFYQAAPPFTSGSFYYNTSTPVPTTAFRYAGHPGFIPAQFHKTTRPAFADAKLGRFYTDGSMVDRQRAGFCAPPNSITLNQFKRPFSPSLPHPDILSHLNSGYGDGDLNKLCGEQIVVQTQADVRGKAEARPNRLPPVPDMESGAGRLHFWPVQGDKMMADSVAENSDVGKTGPGHSHRIHPDELAVVQWLLREAGELNQHLENEQLTNLSVSLTMLEKRALKDSTGKFGVATTDRKTADLDHLLRCILSLGQVVVHYGWWCRPQHWNYSRGPWSKMTSMASHVFRESLQRLNKVVTFYLERIWHADGCRDPELGEGSQNDRDPPQHCAEVAGALASLEEASSVQSTTGQILWSSLSQPGFLVDTSIVQGQPKLSPTFQSCSELVGGKSTASAPKDFVNSTVTESQQAINTDVVHKPIVQSEASFSAVDNSKTSCPESVSRPSQDLEINCGQQLQAHSAVSQQQAREVTRDNESAAVDQVCTASEGPPTNQLQYGGYRPEQQQEQHKHPGEEENSQTEREPGASSQTSKACQQPGHHNGVASAGADDERSLEVYYTVEGAEAEASAAISADSGLGDSIQTSFSMDEGERDEGNVYAVSRETAGSNESPHYVVSSGALADESQAHNESLESASLSSDDASTLSQDPNSLQQKEEEEETGPSVAVADPQGAEFSVGAAANQQMCSGEEVISDHAIMMSETVEIETETDGTVEMNGVSGSHESHWTDMQLMDSAGHDTSDSQDTASQDSNGGRRKRIRAPQGKCNKNSRQDIDERETRGKWNLRSARLSPGKIRTSPRSIPKRF